MNQIEMKNPVLDDITVQLKKIMKLYPEYGMEFHITDWKTDFLRYFHSQTNYIIDKTDLTLSGTIEKDKKKIDFEINAPNSSNIRETIVDCIDMVGKLPPDPDFHSFENNQEIYHYSNMNDSLKLVSPETKTEILRSISELAKNKGFDIFGSFISLKNSIRMINSTGLDKMFYQSPVMLDVKAVSNKNMVTIIESYGGDGLENFHQEEFASRLSQKMDYASLEVVDIEPGKYQTILGPHAISELLQYLTYTAYDSALDEGVSFFEGKEGKAIFPEYIDIISDPFHPEMITVPYNSEGHLAKRTEIITNGKFRNFVMSHYYAQKLKRKKNGSVGNRALELSAGKKALEDMISGIERGLYISNLHYMNFINVKETSVTGLTREGTFLIENGKITKVVNNLRFTQRISEIIENITQLENRRYCIPKSENYDNFNIDSVLVPHVLTQNFKISSSTKMI